MSLKTILQEIPRLSVADRDKVRQALLACGSVGGDTPTPEANMSSMENMLLYAICEVVRSAQGEFVTPSVLSRMSNMASFRRKVPTIEGWLKSQKMRRNEEQALLITSVHYLYDNIVNMGRAVSAHRLCAEIHRLPSVMDEQFPGYARIGMLKLSMRGAKDVRKEPDTRGGSRQW